MTRTKALLAAASIAASVFLTGSAVAARVSTTESIRLVLVSSEVHDMSPDSYFGTTFTLGPTSLWRSGAADCTAVVLDQSRKRARVTASTTFHVDP